MKTIEQLAQEAFEKAAAIIDQDRLPEFKCAPWDKLKPEAREAWAAAARHIVESTSSAMASTQTTLSLVQGELERAMRKFPTWPTDPLHALAVLGEEFGELTKDVLQLTYEPHKTSPQNVRTEAIQTAAMSLRFAASLDAYVYQPSEQHQQLIKAAEPEQEPVVRLTVPESRTGLITCPTQAGFGLEPGEYLCYTSPTPAEPDLVPALKEIFAAEEAARMQKTVRFHRALSDALKLVEQIEALRAKNEVKA